MAPLHEVTAGAQTKTAMRQMVTWTPERQSAFHNTKTALAKATSLIHFTPGAPLALTTDASDFAVGGGVEQLVNNEWRPLGFYSSKFRPTLRERKRPLSLEDHQRSATDRELLAAYRAIQHFRLLAGGQGVHPIHGPRPPSRHDDKSSGHPISHASQAPSDPLRVYHRRAPPLRQVKRRCGRPLLYRD